MSPQPLPHRSWLSTVLFAAVVFIAAYCFIGGLSLIAMTPPSLIERELYGRLPMEQMFHHAGRIGGIAASVFAGWAWRSQNPIRFHLTYLAGLALLVAVLAFVCKVRSYLRILDLHAYQSGFDFLSAPLLALFGTAVALILIVSAIAGDRR